MPLIVVCGAPSTGKTTFTNKFHQYLISHGINSERIVLVNEETLHITKQQGYSSSSNEKSTRGSLKSSVDQKLNSDSFVIVDSMNYIKGFRYELHCVAKSFRTSHCVIWVDCPVEQATAWNNSRLTETGDGYDPLIMNDLRLRFEPPNPSNRWDCPLFKVNSIENTRELSNPLEDISVTERVDSMANPVIIETNTTKKLSSWKPKKETLSKPTIVEINNEESLLENETVFTSMNEMLPKENTKTEKGVWFSGVKSNSIENYFEGQSSDEVMKAVYDHLTSAVVLAPNTPTITVRRADADLLHELDRISQVVVQIIVKHLSNSAEGTPIRFAEYDRELVLNRFVGVAELQRYRLQFVKINGQHPPTNSTAIGSSFIDFLAIHI
eukprot:gene10737-14422_t